MERERDGGTYTYGIELTEREGEMMMMKKKKEGIIIDRVCVCWLLLAAPAAAAAAASLVNTSKRQIWELAAWLPSCRRRCCTLHPSTVNTNLN